MAKNKSKQRRRTLLINPEFQLRFLSFQLISSLITVTVFYAAHSYFFSKMASTGAAVGLPQNHIFFEFLREQEHTMSWIFIGAAVLTTVLLSVLGIYYSHKIAGPLYNLQRFLQHHTFRRRAVRPLKFRDSDFFPELAKDFNMFLNEWNSRRQADDLMDNDDAVKEVAS